MPSLLTISGLLAVSILQIGVLGQDIDTMNDINALCDVNYGSGYDKFVVCLKDGESTTFTTKPNSFLRQSDEHMCCPASNSCLISNSTGNNEVACYDPK